MAEEKTGKGEDKKDERVEERAAMLAPILKSIQIALDGYNDIFSDFDASPYSSRVLSDDFLKEIKKRHYETKKGDFELKFTVPAARRDAKVESTIKKRLKDYFKLETDYFESKGNEIKRDGLHRISAGFVLLSLEVILPILQISDLYIQILSVFIVPAGWYAFYSGFEHLFEESKEFESGKVFYEKFYKAKYEFVSEEEILKNMETPAEQAQQEK